MPATEEDGQHAPFEILNLGVLEAKLSTTPGYLRQISATAIAVMGVRLRLTVNCDGGRESACAGALGAFSNIAVCVIVVGGRTPASTRIVPPT